MKSMQLAMK